MNILFEIAAATDTYLESNHGKLMEFWRMDKLVADMEDACEYFEYRNDINWTIARVRAKNILKQLDLI